MDVEITPEPDADEREAIVRALEELADDEQEGPAPGGWRDDDG